MLLKELLQEKKGEIVDQWVDRVLSTYPGDTSRIFKKGKDRFANPVGFSVKNTLEELYGLLFDREEIDAIPAILEHLVQIRAVQSYTPSEAVAFAYVLKKIVKEEYRKAEIDDFAGWLSFEATMDIVAHTVFDLYTICRERLYQVRIAELKSGNHIMADGGCPSALMRKNKARKDELNIINLHSST
jgi:hypothetical protein